MRSNRRKIHTQFLQLFDLVNMVAWFVGISVLVSYPAQTVSLAQFFAIRIKIQNFLLFFVILWTWNFMFSFLGLYLSRRIFSRRREIIDILKATTSGTLIIFFLAYLFNVEIINIRFLFIFWVCCSVSTILMRLLLRILLHYIRQQGRNLRNIIIVGTNHRAIRFAEKIKAKTELGYRLVGFVDDTWAGLPELQEKGHTLVADLEGFPAFLRESIVDEVMVCLPVKSFYEQNLQIVALCEKQGIIVRFLPDFFDLRRAHAKTETFQNISVITIRSGTMDGWPILVKSLMDKIVSLALLILFSPILLTALAMIRLTSVGPVFFKQERLGINKRRFQMYKLRTMVVDAEKKLKDLEHLNEASGPAFKIKEDPRITPVGKFLRKTSIDELPQLFNVLKGDMSLVGPRPLPVRDYEGFDKDWHRRRFSVRPGITCLWQISGRNNISFDRWMELDMEYIDQWSLGLDLKILCRTIPAVLRGTGAN